MGTPQTIVYGLPFQFESCHGALMFDQFVASMTSSAYLIELEEPSQVAAVSIPDGPDLPSYRPSPGATVDEPPDAFALDQLVVALALGLPDGDPHAAVKVAIPAIATMARPGILARLRARCIKDKLSPLLCVGSEICEQMPSRRSSWQLESEPPRRRLRGNSVLRIRNDNTTIRPLVGFEDLLSCCPAWCRLLHTRSRPVVRADR